MASNVSLEPPTGGTAPSNERPLSPELLAAIYQTLGSRRIEYDTMMWQAPAISFTAQAFLLTLALSGKLGVAQLVSAALAFIISLISMQLMAKHRFNEEIDSRLLEAFEKNVDIESIIGCPPHAPPGIRLRTVNSGEGVYEGVRNVRSSWFTRISSYHLWQRGIALFALTSLGIVAVNITHLAGWDATIAQWWSDLMRLIP